MEQRVKERLTGASILVVVVVLLVPELFRGERHATATAPAAHAAGPPLQSYTIELGAPPAAAPALATAPPQLPPPASASSPTPAAAAGTVAAPTVTAAAAPAPAPAPAAPAAIVPKTRPETSAPPASAKEAGSGWVVQVGSFSKRDNAARMVQQAAKKGLRLSIAGPDDRGLFRVRSSMHADRAKVVELQQMLAAKGYKGMIARAP